MDFLIPIVAISCGASIALYGMYIKHEKIRLQASAQSGESSDQTRRMEAELADVKARLQVLESLVTDEDVKLNREFSELERAQNKSA